MRHSYGYEPTAEALALQLCALTSLQRKQRVSSGSGGSSQQEPEAAPSVAEVRYHA